MNREELEKLMDNTLNRLFLRSNTLIDDYGHLWIGKNRDLCSGTGLESDDVYLLELYKKVRDHRATGRTSRIINETIDRLLTKPIGTVINITDHYFDGSELDHRKAKEIVLDRVRGRLLAEFPNIEYNVLRQDGKIGIVRKSPTAREQLVEEYEKILKIRLKEKNENYSNK